MKILDPPLVFQNITILSKTQQHTNIIILHVQVATRWSSWSNCHVSLITWPVGPLNRAARGGTWSTHWGTTEETKEVKFSWRQEKLEDYRRGCHGYAKYHVISAINSLYFVDDLGSDLGYLLSSIEPGGFLIVVLDSGQLISLIFWWLCFCWKSYSTSMLFLAAFPMGVTTADHTFLPIPVLPRILFKPGIYIHRFIVRIEVIPCIFLLWTCSNYLDFDKPITVFGCSCHGSAHRQTRHCFSSLPGMSKWYVFQG